MDEAHQNRKRSASVRDNAVRKNRKGDKKPALNELAAKRRRRELSNPQSCQQSLQMQNAACVFSDKKESKIISLWKKNSLRIRSY